MTLGRWNRTTISILVSVLLALVLSASAAAQVSETSASDDLAYPAPTGPYPVGVHDFEFVDTVYPVDRERDAEGRRLMVRVWYPAAGAIGEPRSYFEAGELEALGHTLLESLSMFVPDGTLLDPFDDLRTHSYVDAPIGDDPDGFPTIVFSHGALAYVSHNTALMEDLASHGYLIFSVAHPDGASGVLYPDGDAVRFDSEFHTALLGVAAPNEGLSSTDVGERYTTRTARYVDDHGLGPWLSRWRDDLIAMVDLIEAGAGEGPLASILAQADLSRLAYFGMSYGGSAAASAAHVDERARAVVDLDGTHHGSDLLGTDLRVPLLLFSSEPIDYHAYSNEFFFESLTTMGERSDIVRVWIPEVSHFELMDTMFLSPTTREALPGGGSADGQRVHETLTSFILGFFDHHLKEHANGFPEAHFEMFPEVRAVDVSYVKEWARSR